MQLQLVLMTWSRFSSPLFRLYFLYIRHHMRILPEAHTGVRHHSVLVLLHVKNKIHQVCMYVDVSYGICYINMFQQLFIWQIDDPEQLIQLLIISVNIFKHSTSRQTKKYYTTKAGFLNVIKPKMVSNVFKCGLNKCLHISL